MGQGDEGYVVLSLGLSVLSRSEDGATSGLLDGERMRYPELGGYVARYRCLACGGRWARRWRVNLEGRNYNIGFQVCPRDPENHHYIEWENFDEWCLIYTAEVREKYS
jgi:hypothetical protein